MWIGAHSDGKGKTLVLTPVDRREERSSHVFSDEDRDDSEYDAVRREDNDERT